MIDPNLPHCLPLLITAGSPFPTLYLISKLRLPGGRAGSIWEVVSQSPVSLDGIYCPSPLPLFMLRRGKYDVWLGAGAESVKRLYGLIPSSNYRFSAHASELHPTLLNRVGSNTKADMRETKRVHKPFFASAWAFYSVVRVCGLI